MTFKNIKGADIGQLIDAYRNAVRSHGSATEGGDHKAANAAAEQIAAIYIELRIRGKAAQDCLLWLLDDPDPAVQLWSASHALEFSPAEGEVVLERLVSKGGLPGFDAKMTLKEWRAGRLRFP